MYHLYEKQFEKNVYIQFISREEIATRHFLFFLSSVAGSGKMASWGKLQALFVSTIQQIFLKKYVWLDARTSVDSASSILCILVSHSV